MIHTQNNNYTKIHLWISKFHGKASKCENLACKGKSDRYEWAKLKNKDYDFKRENFIQLCKSCHNYYDYKEGRKIKKTSIKNVSEKTSACIKNIRIKLCYQRNEFARLLGITSTALSNYEEKNRVPRLDILYKIINFAKKNKMKYSVEDFLGG